MGGASLDSASFPPFRIKASASCCRAPPAQPTARCGALPPEVARRAIGELPHGVERREAARHARHVLLVQVLELAPQAAAGCATAAIGLVAERAEGGANLGGVGRGVGRGSDGGGVTVGGHHLAAASWGAPCRTLCR
jgi:hypothetical protein